MDRSRRFSLLAIIAMLLVVGGRAVSDLISPPYTDQQIQASLVDTWEVEAGSTTALLVLLAVTITVSLALAYHRKNLTLRLSALTVLLAVLAGVLAFSSHVVLTNRVTQLTGQTFGSLYGLL